MPFFSCALADLIFLAVDVIVNSIQHWLSTDGFHSLQKI